ncbi:hypothetical protein HDU76_009126 [Blyttiomyces sp. JEL0837]|nr:hypothetical protein HDU76_009126 [Blyttiomyces sp. JEL0837]
MPIRDAKPDFASSLLDLKHALLIRIEYFDARIAAALGEGYQDRRFNVGGNGNSNASMRRRAVLDEQLEIIVPRDMFFVGKVRRKQESVHGGGDKTDRDRAGSVMGSYPGWMASSNGNGSGNGGVKSSTMPAMTQVGDSSQFHSLATVATDASGGGGGGGGSASSEIGDNNNNEGDDRSEVGEGLLNAELRRVFKNETEDGGSNNGGGGSDIAPRSSLDQPGIVSGSIANSVIGTNTNTLSHSHSSFGNNNASISTIPSTSSMGSLPIITFGPASRMPPPPSPAHRDASITVPIKLGHAASPDDEPMIALFPLQSHSDTPPIPSISSVMSGTTGGNRRGNTSPSITTVTTHPHTNRNSHYSMAGITGGGTGTIGPGSSRASISLASVLGVSTTSRSVFGESGLHGGATGTGHSIHTTGGHTHTTIPTDAASILSRQTSFSARMSDSVASLRGFNPVKNAGVVPGSGILSFDHQVAMGAGAAPTTNAAAAAAVLDASQSFGVAGVRNMGAIGVGVTGGVVSPGSSGSGSLIRGSPIPLAGGEGLNTSGGANVAGGMVGVGGPMPVVEDDVVIHEPVETPQVVIVGYQPVETQAPDGETIAVEDQLAMSKGDHVIVSEIFDDGWAVGTNLSNSTAGLFPMNLVKFENPLGGLDDGDQDLLGHGHEDPGVVDELQLSDGKPGSTHHLIPAIQSTPPPPSAPTTSVSQTIPLSPTTNPYIFPISRSPLPLTPSPSQEFPNIALMGATAAPGFANQLAPAYLALPSTLLQPHPHGIPGGIVVGSSVSSSSPSGQQPFRPVSIRTGSTAASSVSVAGSSGHNNVVNVVTHHNTQGLVPLMNVNQSSGNALGSASSIPNPVAAAGDVVAPSQRQMLQMQLEQMRAMMEKMEASLKLVDDLEKDALAKSRG